MTARAWPSRGSDDGQGSLLVSLCSSKLLAPMTPSQSHFVSLRIVCVYVCLSVCVYMHFWQQRPKEGIGSPIMRIMILIWCWKLNLSLLKEQLVFSSVQPSFPPSSHFILMLRPPLSPMTFLKTSFTCMCTCTWRCMWVFRYVCVCACLQAKGKPQVVCLDSSTLHSIFFF